MVAKQRNSQINQVMESLGFCKLVEQMWNFLALALSAYFLTNNVSQ